jgi:hypothetical protein
VACSDRRLSAAYVQVIVAQSNVCPGKHPCQVPSLHITVFAQSTGKFQQPFGSVWAQKNGWSDAQHTPMVPSQETTGRPGSLHVGQVSPPQAGPQPQTPAEHGMPAGQTLPQLPQLSESPPVVRTHVPSHMVICGGHGWQAPPTQASIPQLLPQDPQFAGSVWVLVQSPLHTVWPGVQAHVPSTQLLAFWHALPQLAQFCASCVKSAHTPLQQALPDGHVTPHPPQLFGSSPATTVHWPAQPTAPPGQLRSW